MMKDERNSESRKQDRQIIGISLPPDVACEFKAEAGRRGVSLQKLFEELWRSYGKDSAKAGSR